MIRLDKVSKIYPAKEGVVKALDQVSLQVKKGEIFGVIGHSGAGKSTLIRCVNLLERPTEGEVYVGGVNLTTLSPSQLRKARRKIGMIFQGFNLLKTATVYENIALPLRLAGLHKNEIAERVEKYLSVVGLSDRQHAYPSQLSGGQKQRVAIARALSHEPEVLLSDEATSALDPETTEAILELLLSINQQFGITILMITHDMQVIQKVCDRVAVVEKGKIIEQGSTLELFTSPVHETTKKFVHSLFRHEVPSTIIEALRDQGPIVTLSFVRDSSSSPLLAEISKRFAIKPNILAGNIAQLKNVPFGRLMVHLQGEPEAAKQAVHFLEDQGVRVEGEMNDAREVEHVS